MPTKRYNVIYADPPWAYKNYAYAETLNGDRAKRGVVKEYPTMTVDEIAALPVESIAADDATLFLWVTMPLLQEILRTTLFESWGFEFKTCAFIWIKQNSAHNFKHPALWMPEDKKVFDLFWGMGNYTRQNAEICLLGRRGKPERKSAGVHQVIFEPVMKHSCKPETVRRRIVELLGDVPRVELFARQATDGWDVWGNEVEGVPLFDTEPSPELTCLV